jgi:hypothetical protein
MSRRRTKGLEMLRIVQYPNVILFDNFRYSFSSSPYNPCWRGLNRFFAVAGQCNHEMAMKQQEINLVCGLFNDAVSSSDYTVSKQDNTANARACNWMDVDLPHQLHSTECSFKHY